MHLNVNWSGREDSNLRPHGSYLRSPALAALFFLWTKLWPENSTLRMPIARTDALEASEIARRVEAFAKAGGGCHIGTWTQLKECTAILNENLLRRDRGRLET